MDAFKKYRVFGHRAVQGWLHPEVLDVLAVLDAEQGASDVGGAVAEIGVHHGRLFIGLDLLKRTGESSVAIDLFDDQSLNIDDSGKGDFAKFQANIGRWSQTSGVVIHGGDSTQLDGQQVIELAGQSVRLFSVDGGHTQEIVLADMRTAEQSLAVGGIVIADDVFNAEWPGVVVGTLDYMNSGGKLVPFALGFNKVFFAAPAHADVYRAVLEESFGGRTRICVKSSVMSGHEVLVLFAPKLTPRYLASRNAKLKEIYKRFKA